ncbi:hypothetical protein [Micromonospora sp. NPDC047738]|uniref:hypothetical protein n=1 Tax=unclassified Micromonospora TaxID=2617518 RepID=UPI0034044233
MTVVPYEWQIWTDGPAREDWPLEKAAACLAASLRRITRTLPSDAGAFQAGADGPPFSVNDPDLPRHLVPQLAASRDRSRYGGGDLLGNARILLQPVGPGLLWLDWSQPAAELPTSRANLRVTVTARLGPILDERLGEVAALVADLGRIWEADQAWVDMVHVRQEWNRWRRGLPVFGVVTWFRTGGATVDTSGLDVDTVDTDDGRLIVLRAAPADVEADTSAAARATVRELTRRTVLADGRLLTEANPALLAEPEGPS